MIDEPAGPLAGVFVLDLSRVLAGPWSTQILGDLGADVVKVERPDVGDDTRAWGPPFVRDADGKEGDAAYFLCANRNKRSISIDMANPEGAALIARLADQADVLVENFKTGGLKRYGLDYATLSARNPRLVYCSVTGFGQDGPYAARPGYDFMIQGMGGLMSVTGEGDGVPGAQPLRAGVAVADLFTGLYAANGVLAALLHARATGQGQHIDMALFDVQAAMLANQASNYFVSGQAPSRQGNTHPNLAPYQVFASADGALIIAVGNDGQFRALCEMLGAPALAKDPRFIDNASRVANRQALTAALAGPLVGETTAHWIVALEKAGVPCGPINTIDQVFAEPQALARHLVVEQTRDDVAGSIRTVASPLRLSVTPPSYRRPPPALGAHTREVLAERLGLDEAALARFTEMGAL